MVKKGEDWSINTIAEYIGRRVLLWRGVLEVLYENRKMALTVHEIHKKYAERYKMPLEIIDRRGILRVLKRLEQMELIRLVQIKGLRGKRWIITEKGIKVYERLREQ